MAELAAQGRDDREIAEALYVTPIAVQRNLEAVCRKLGVESREALSDLLAVA